MLKTGVIFGVVALTTFALGQTRLIGPIGPCANARQTIAVLTFAGSSILATVCFAGSGLRWLASRFPRG